MLMIDSMTACRMRPGDMKVVDCRAGGFGI